MALRAIRFARTFQVMGVRAMSGEWGSGAGKGGGSGGSVRDAGGAFGKVEAAREEQYFRQLQQRQLAEFREHLKSEVEEHEAEIKRLQQEKKLRELKEHLHDEVHELERQIRDHEDAIQRRKQRLEKLKEDQGSDSD